MSTSDQQYDLKLSIHQTINNSILEAVESELFLHKLDERVKPYVYNLELLESMLEQKAKSSMSRRRKAPRDLDRLYLTSSAYKEQRMLRGSVQDKMNISESVNQRLMNTEVRKSMPESGSVNYELISRKRNEIYTEAKQLQKQNLKQQRLKAQARYSMVMKNGKLNPINNLQNLM